MLATTPFLTADAALQVAANHIVSMLHAQGPADLEYAFNDVQMHLGIAISALSSVAFESRAGAKEDEPEWIILNKEAAEAVRALSSFALSEPDELLDHRTIGFLGTFVPRHFFDEMVGEKPTIH